MTQPAAPAAYAAPQPAAPAAPYAEVRPVVPEEDVVARIDRISREGAPLSVMREVALLLQQERAKPENKTPEQQRRLNEALSKLLKAMSRQPLTPHCCLSERRPHCARGACGRKRTE